MNSYEQKQERRRERLEEAAERARREGEARVNRGREMLDAIPFGQPILVGHHSEKRDRNYRNRAWNNMGKGFESLERAKELEARAAAVGSGGISSDDPDAVAKLREELAELNAKQERMRAANKIIRGALPRRQKDRLERDPATGATVLVKAAEVPADPAKIERAVTALIELGFPDGVARELFKPDFCGRIGYPDYALKNNGANMRRVEGRIAQLEQRERAKAAIAAEVEAAAEAGAPPPNETVIGAVRIVQNVEANRTQVFFPGKPAHEVRAKLKSYGFRWAPSEGAWQRHLSNAATHYAKEIAQGVANG